MLFFIELCYDFVVCRILIVLINVKLGCWGIIWKVILK